METGKNKGMSQRLKRHFVDSTALWTATSPLFSVMDVGVLGVSAATSIGSRIDVVALTYAGLGTIFSGGRRLSRRFFQITDKSKERAQAFYDFLYTAGFNFVFATPIYLFNGADLSKSFLGGLMAAGMSAFTGPINGYAIDVGEDMAGIERCERSSYPDFVRRQSPIVKKGLAALVVAGSIAVMTGIYSFASNRDRNYDAPQRIESQR